MARTILESTKNFTKLHAVNSKNGIAIKDMAGENIIVNALGIIEAPDPDTGEVKKVGVIIAEDGTAYTTISAGAMETISDCIEIMTELETETIMFHIEVRKSKGGRDFVQITVSEMSF